jgi:hypothetical protein
MLGRNAAQLLGVMDDINPKIDEATEAERKNSATNESAAAASKQLHDVLTQLKSAWEDAIVNVAPAVVTALKIMTEGMKEAKGAAQELMAAVGALSKGDFGGAGRAIGLGAPDTMLEPKRCSLIFGQSNNRDGTRQHGRHLFARYGLSSFRRVSKKSSRPPRMQSGP